ncbi:MAG: nucleoside transporter C-terminal domain-containing protein [Burkholderiaceae bacterium]
MDALQGLFGVAAMLALCWVLSEDRQQIPWRMVVSGIVLAALLAIVLLKVPPLAHALAALNGVLAALEAALAAGTSFVFGHLGGGATPYTVTDPSASFVLAFRALPLVLIIAALSAVLFHWGVMPLIVRAFAWALQRTMGLGGAVGVSAAANVFVGMVEAPLVIAPYLARLSRGELFIVMNCGMATIAGTVLVLYASFLGPVVPNALGHLLVASIVATPVAIAVAAVLVPPQLTDASAVAFERQDANTMVAITRGTLEGLQLLLNIVAMLVVFVALVALANGILGSLPVVNGAPLTLERLFGWVFAPLAWLVGVPASEVLTAGKLLGQKTVLNEFIAYIEMAKMGPDELSPRSALLMTYALAGFANFGSLGIMLGGLDALLPKERRAELATLGLKSILAGLLSTCITAALVGLVV